MADGLYRRYRLSNKTFKTTGPGRLRDVDEFLIGHLKSDESVRVLDVAASSASTSVELFRSLKAWCEGCQVVASDLTMSIGIAQRFGITAAWELSATQDPTHVLQVDIGPLPIQNSLAGRLPLHKVLRWVAPKSPMRLVPFACAAAKRMQREDPNFTLASFDIMTGIGTVVGQFDIVRIANLLHRSYFSDARIVDALTTVFSILREGGILLIARTDDAGRNAASLFRRQGCGFMPMADLNGGSDIKALVTSVRAPVYSGD